MNPITTPEQAKVAGAYDSQYGLGAYKDTPITSDTLNPSTPLTLPPASPNTSAAGLQGTISAQAQQYGQSVVDQQKLKEAQVKQTGYEGDIQSIFDKLGTKGDATNAAYSAEGVDTAKTALTDVNNSILAEQNALNHQKEAIYGTPGITREQANNQFSEVQRLSLAKQADLSVIQYAAQNKYSDAKAIADRKIEMQFEPLQTKLEALKFFYGENKDTLTKAEDRQFQATIAERTRLLADEKEKAKTLQDTKLQAIKDAKEGGAPISVLSAIQAATTPEDALKAQGRYLSAEARLKNAQAAKAFNEINPAPNGPALPQDYQSFLQSRTPEQTAAFNALNSTDKSTVAQLVNGDALLSDLVKSRGAQGTKDIARLIQAATAVDPTFSVNANKVRYNFLQQWNNPNGKISTTRNAINTALGHLADFKASADSLDAGTVRKLNSVKNVLITETGDPKVLQLRTDINALASEIATIYKGASPTEKEILNWEQTIAADFSKAQFKGVSDEISKLLSSKVTATRYQYKSTMGSEYGQSLIDPDKKQALVDAGIDPNSFVKEKVPTQQGNAGGTVVTAPDGTQVIITD